jgi:hypothetical protein
MSSDSKLEDSENSESSSPTISDEDKNPIESDKNKSPIIKNLSIRVLKRERINPVEDNITKPIPDINNVYLFREGNTNNYKIGFSKNPIQRLRTLSTGNSTNLSIIACCPGNLDLEIRLKNKYKPYKKENEIATEWFIFDSVKILEVIDEYRSIRSAYDEIEEVKTELPLEFNIGILIENNNLDLKLANFLCSMIPPEVLMDELTWIKIGKALYNVEDPETSLEIFIKISNNISDEKKCRDIWPSFEGNLLSIKTLGWLFRYHSKESYEEWHHAWVEFAVKKAYMNISNSENDIFDIYLDIAHMIYNYFWLDLVCSRFGGDGEWFYYNKNHYEKIEIGGIGRKIMEDFFPFIIRILFRLKRELSSLPCNVKNRRKKKEIEEKMANLRKIIKLIIEVDSRKKILDLCKEEFYVEDFRSKSNRYSNIIGWGNCVTEIYQNKIYVRDGMPEDYLTINSETNYRFDFHLGHPSIKKLLKYLHQVFADPDIYEFFLKDLSAILLRGNHELFTRVWTGVKNSYMGNMVKLLKSWLGDLLAFSDEEINSSTLLVVNMEPKNIVKIIVKADYFMKFIDPKIIYVWQHIPYNIITHINITPILFLSSWQENAPAEKEERYIKRIFKIKENFDEIVPSLGEALLWFAINNFDTYIAEGLEVPKKLKNFQKEQREVFGLSNKDFYKLYGR